MDSFFLEALRTFSMNFLTLEGLDNLRPDLMTTMCFFSKALTIRSEVPEGTVIILSFLPLAFLYVLIMLLTFSFNFLDFLRNLRASFKSSLLNSQAMERFPYFSTTSRACSKSAVAETKVNFFLAALLSDLKSLRPSRTRRSDLASSVHFF